MALIAAAFILGGKGPAVSPTTAVAIARGRLARGRDPFTSVGDLHLRWLDRRDLLSEEVKDPGRDIPRSMFGGVLLVIGIYLLVNLALVYVLPISKIAGQEFRLLARPRR